MMLLHLWADKKEEEKIIIKKGISPSDDIRVSPSPSSSSSAAAPGDSRYDSVRSKGKCLSNISASKLS